MILLHDRSSMARKYKIIIAQKGESLKFEVNGDKCDTSIFG